MTPQSFKNFARLTSDITAPVAEVLLERREELRVQMIHTRKESELIRLQGRAEEIDAILEGINSQ